MLSVFKYAFGYIETVMTMRMINKQYLAWSRDTYILDNFGMEYSGLRLEIRHIDMLDIMLKAIRYLDIVSAPHML